MGVKLEKIFQIVEEKAGNNGRLKLAQMTKIAKAQAKEVKDEPEIIALFKRAASDILGKNVDEFLT